MDNRSSVLKHANPTNASSRDVFMNDGDKSEALFVINLSAANMPQAIDAHSVQSWGIAGLERYRLYQVSRMEEGRRRYRMRLGFFTTEADAESVLQKMRGRFATAFTSCLCDEDLKHASGYLKKPLHEIQEIQDLQRTGRYRIPKIAHDLPESEPVVRAAAPAATPVAKKSVAPPPVAPSAPSMSAARVAPPPAAKPRPAANQEEMVEFEWTPDPNVGARTKLRTPVVAPAINVAAQTASVQKPAPVHATSAPAKTAPPQKIELKLETPVAPAPAAKAATRPAQPFHVGAGRTIADSGLGLELEKKLAQTKSAPATAQPQLPAAAAKPNIDLPRPLVSAEALAKLRAAAQPRNEAAVIPTLDTTQTIRTLTKTEIEDANAPKWFVVQLAISDQPANLDTMPRLDIFEAYRLYSVAVMEGAVIRHALRLGFFREHVSAEAVLGYLKTFFGDPRIERISDAEQTRFAEPLVPKISAPEPAKVPSRIITLEEKRAKPLPLTNTPKIAPKSAGYGVRRSAPLAKKNGKPAAAPKKTVSQQELANARLLGLSETAIRRVEQNPSLLSRLVDKLTK